VISGFLEPVNFEDGAEVKQGDVLFVIDDRHACKQVAYDSETTNWQSTLQSSTNQ